MVFVFGTQFELYKSVTINATLMKTLKLLFAIIITGTVLSSCTVYNDTIIEEVPPTLEEVVSGYDLWYVDYNSTVGNGDVPFVSKAFTLSFINGTLYANNNITDIGRTGNGFGIDVGVYDTFRGILETDHDIDGFVNFNVEILSNNEIEIYNSRENVSYILVGYQRNEFDYDRLFYENIEYFLQEYTAWEKITTEGGVNNFFDEENFLQFTPENLTTFYSSRDNFGTRIENINWDYVGGYEVFDVIGFDDLKILTLNYEGGDNEEFELSVINDGSIALFSTTSNTTYTFSGKGFLQFLKSGEKKSKKVVRNEGRKRTKVERRSKERKI